jgi:hypothetical protein
MGESSRGSMWISETMTEEVFFYSICNLSGNWLGRYGGGPLAASHLCIIGRIYQQETANFKIFKYRSGIPKERSCPLKL